MHRVLAYVVEGECDALATQAEPDTSPEECRVRVADLGAMPLPLEAPTLVLRYRGGAFGPVTLSIGLNANSTLRSLGVGGDVGAPGLFIQFGPLGSGVW